MNDTSIRKPARHTGRRMALVALAALLLGLAAGARWHAAIGDWLGAGPAASSPEATEPKQIWTCSMHPQVLQDRPGACPICGMTLVPIKNHGAAGGAAAGAAPGGFERKIRYWWDPMLGPSSISPAPGKSAMGMDLVPVYEDEVVAGEAVTIDPVVVQNMGVRVAEVVEAPLHRTVRAVGSLREPEPARVDVNLRVSGWIERLQADTEGMAVRQDDVLFELYSPEVVVAVEELIAARRARDDGASRGTPPPSVGAGAAAGRMYEAAVAKLRFWGLDDDQVAELERMEHAPRTVAFRSPITGHVTEKMVVEGAALQAGEMVLRLSDRSTMWLDVSVFEADLRWITVGQTATARVDAVPGTTFEGPVTFIHPHLDELTRTALVRIGLDNPNDELRQSMYATAEFAVEVDPRAVVVPREAILDSGERQIAFVSLGGGRFEPRRVELGGRGEDDLVQVLSGLAPGEKVVTSGQFLLDSESRLREAIARQLADGLLAPPAEGAEQVRTPGGHQH